MKTINCLGNLIDLETPRVMGVLNLTPDSFYDGGKYKSEKQILKQVEKMLIEGATFIDVGAYSSRPGASHVSVEEERSRLLPALELILTEFDKALVSVDTFRSEIARESVNAGAALINDISAGQLDPQMFATMGQLQVPYIIMHMKGTPQNMQSQVQYDNLVREIIYYFSERVFELRKLGVNDIIIDPGYGFSKTLEQNYELLGKSELLGNLGLPVLTGVSRKSMLYKLIGTGPEEALAATVAAQVIALLKGTSILRAHDVKEAVEAIKIVEKTKLVTDYD
ncbi:MAG: dihydropteroate synthase [Lutimonas sp.]